MLKSEKLLEENQSQLFRIEEMLEVYMIYGAATNKYPDIY